ncbi:MAG: hypothetical protein JSR60_14520 [Proteobacteria bacterium]|nr:hypothetical protein [Pseudomonadota bacterium]
MSDERDSARMGAPGDPAASGIALGHPLDPKAAAYLDEQTRLARLQAESLIEQNAFELSHLRFRRFGDWAKFALELSVALVVLLVLAGLGTMVWDASRDHDLVVDAFSVPADIAQSGMTGNVLAARVLDRFGAMDTQVATFTQDFSSYHRAGEAVRVEIPDTGISLGEIDQLLRRWLGHETHVSGELVHTPKGLSLTVRYDGEPGVTAEGGDLDALIVKSAENMFAAVKPLRFADYLTTHHRAGEALGIVTREASRGDNLHRAAAFDSWSFIEYWQGSSEGIARRSAMALALNPADPIANFTRIAVENNLDHEEGIYTASAAYLAAPSSANDAEMDPAAAHETRVAILAGKLQAEGNFLDAIAACGGAAHRESHHGACSDSGIAGLDATLHDTLSAFRILNAGLSADSSGVPHLDWYFLRVQASLAADDIPQALVALPEAEAAAARVPGSGENRIIFLVPFEAEVLARAGRIAEARSLVATTPVGCDLCARARGRIEMVARNWAVAAHWFKLVSDRSIHIPYADTDWGQMLLLQGRTDAAIDRLAIAHRKGPHFADPLELWGEALIVKNRSDLATKKFAEAARYAPNWGRLHLKWGEALLWSGDKSGAAKQFALAGALFLTPQERGELTRVSHV